MSNLVNIFKHLAILLFTFLFIRYIGILVIIWGLIEVIVYCIKHKNAVRIKEFICNFVLTVLTCINILCNVVLQVPANRILLTTTENAPHKFGNPKRTFTNVLKLNFLYGNLNTRGIMLYKIVSFFKIKNNYD